MNSITDIIERFCVDFKYIFYPEQLSMAIAITRKISNNWSKSLTAVEAV